MLRFASGLIGDSETVEGAVMKPMVWRDGWLSLTGIFQRPLLALTGKCCLLPVFFFFPMVQGLVLLQAAGFLNRSYDVYWRHPASESKKRLSLSSLRTPLFSV